MCPVAALISRNRQGKGSPRINRTAAAVILSRLLVSLLARRINRRLQRLTVAANRLATEELPRLVDRIHQLDPELFESDRRRQNALVLGGWRVLRFTWRMLAEDPGYFTTQVRRALTGK